MGIQDVHCVAPASPELEDKIHRTKRAVMGAQTLPTVGTADLLDMRSYALIQGRPAKTRPNTFTLVRDVAPVLGVRKAIVLLVDFSDVAATTAHGHYHDMLFSQGTYATGSMRDFFKEASYNQVDVDGEISAAGGPTAGWHRAPQPKSYYTNGNFGFGSYPRNAQRLAEDVIDLANPFVNFSQYDNDGDGVVEALVIIAAGSGGEVTGDAGDIWSHKWGITPKNVDGVQINTYFMAPEDGRVGVMSHELGHLLMSWPDLYDTDYSSRGTGRWDLMAGGSWNNGGHTPAHPVAWCKAQAGWVNPTVIFNAQQNVTVQPFANNAQVYKLPIGTTASKQYFLLSNRQQTGFDANIPGEGLIIEHVDDNQSNNTDETHYLVNIEQADGLEHLNNDVNAGDTTDPYPTASNDEFTGSSNPNSNSYSGTSSDISVTDIKNSGSDITATINVGAASALAWHYNKTVLMTYAWHTSQWAWANIESLGWRRIKDGSADGTTNMFDAFCEAQASGKKVHVYADGSFISGMNLV